MAAFFIVMGCVIVCVHACLYIECCEGLPPAVDMVVIEDNRPLQIKERGGRGRRGNTNIRQFF